MKNIFNIGVIGTGDIFKKAYAPNITTRFCNLKLMAIADIQMERAKKLAEEFGIEKVLSPEELMNDPEIDIIVNLTNPLAHYELNMQILRSGKHLYSEKPLALTEEEAEEIIKYAKEHNLSVGSAPDVFLGAGVQTVLKVLESGEIGDILSIKVANMYHGPEVGHPAPDFFYKHGGGPMLDIGPYGIHEMLLFMGPVEEICCYGGTGINPRPIKGHLTDVEVPTHYNGIVRFKNGKTGSVNFSWDVWGAEFGSAVQVYGKKGTIFLTDPDNYGTGSKVHMILENDLLDKDGKLSSEKMSHQNDYKKDVPLVFESPRDNRGIGLCEMVEAIKEGKKARVNSEFALHLTEVLNGFNVSMQTGQPYKVKSSFDPIERLPEDFYKKMMEKKEI